MIFGAVLTLMSMLYQVDIYIVNANISAILVPYNAMPYEIFGTLFQINKIIAERKKLLVVPTI